MKDKALAGYATIIVVVVIVALVALSISNHAVDLSKYMQALSGPVSALVVLIGVRPKAKEAADNAADFTDDQRSEIETIVIQALTDYGNGKRPQMQGART